MSWGSSIRKAALKVSKQVGASGNGTISSTSPSQSSGGGLFSGTGLVRKAMKKVTGSSFGQVVSAGSFNGAKSNKKPLG